MTGQAAGAAWPSCAPPDAREELAWELSQVSELPGLRADLRQYATAQDAAGGPDIADLHDRLILALDEMASNALRHGGSGAVRATLRTTTDAWLIDVADAASGCPPAPAVGRDPSEGGLGLYLIAELATAHGWYADGDRKHVWALLPRR